MPDIRDVLNALEEKDAHLYRHVRTIMRSDYLNSVHEILGIRNYNQEDDAFLDLIDIKLAILFERAGKFNNAKGTIDEEAANMIEQQIVEAAAGIKTNPVTQSQRVLESFAPKSVGGQSTPNSGWNN